MPALGGPLGEGPAVAGGGGGCCSAARVAAAMLRGQVTCPVAAGSGALASADKCTRARRFAGGPTGANQGPHGRRATSEPPRSLLPVQVMPQPPRITHQTLTSARPADAACPRVRSAQRSRPSPVSLTSSFRARGRHGGHRGTPVSSCTFRFKGSRRSRACCAHAGPIRAVRAAFTLPAAM